jgi:hypothetical protein
MPRHWTAWYFVVSIISLSLSTDAQSLGRDTQTSSSCQIGGIKKGITGKQCDVPIPPACKVATNVSTQTRWTDIEKSGGMSCRFDPKLTDWKTRITGSCSKCLARQCTAKFTVYFDCPQSTAAP